MPIDLYWHPLSASSRATAITAQYLGVAVNLKEVDWLAGATREPDFLKINPSHTVPTLVDNGFALFESRAIMTYLANNYAPTSSIYPQDAQARAQVDKILYFDASSYNSALRAIFVPLVYKKHEPSGQVLGVLKETIQILESLLGEQKFFAGETATLADISIGAGSLWVMQLFPDLWTDKMESWYQRLVRSVPQFGEINGKVDLTVFLPKK